ncbi:peptidoglycan DD-metalloendopeptidase family protein [Rhodovastum atsumiense]|uniref:Peptidoglycan DD-metalloendopeptidase family protein n=2 Tax=Rhodovastum atsumiense TaxID=504468 RepID=A0A5M6J3N3_9PROT|nr:peptidoglycan DD-metalloendopeptidase family protein [Rhodovastum atsumiense]
MTMQNAPWIFPGLGNRRWVELRLDALARADFPDITVENPLNDPEFCDRWITALTARLGADHSWGGWLEDRTHLWRGHYLPEGCFIHLGIDLNVPAGTTVLAPVTGEVVHAIPCGLLGGGGGGWIVLRADTPQDGAAFVVLGHLAHEGLPPPGTRLVRGAVAGMIGTPQENGGWYPHLHLQSMSEAAWEMVQHAPDTLLDGYAPADAALPHLFPDPAPLVGLRPRSASHERSIDSAA